MDRGAEISERTLLQKPKNAFSRRSFLKRALAGFGAAGFLKNRHGILEAAEPNLSKVVDGILTYGSSENPLSNDQIASAAFPDMQEVPDYEHTYFTSILIDQKSYAKFHEKHPDISFQQYLSTNIGALNKLLEESSDINPARKSKVAVRELIFAQEDFTSQDDSSDPYSGLPTISVRIEDQSIKNTEIELNSDSSFVCVAGESILGSDFDQATGVDRLFVNNLLRKALNLPSGYFYVPQDFDGGEVFDGVLGDHIKYSTDLRNDYIGDTFIQSGEDGELYPGIFSRLLLDQRQINGNIHGMDIKIQGGDVFVVNIPEYISINLGSNYADSKVEIFQKKTRVDEQTNQAAEVMLKKGEYTAAQDGVFGIAKKDIFGEDTILAGSENIFFVRATDQAGKVSYRWLDIRDFAALEFAKNDDGINEISMNLRTSEIGDRPFDWTVRYNGKTLRDIVNERSNNLEADIETNPINPRESESIDGLETYGEKSPLKPDQILDLHEYLNSLDTDVDEDTYYSTMYISKSTYELFRYNNQESFQKFLKRHESRMQQMFAQQAEDIKEKTLDFEIRRLIVVDDSANMDMNWRYTTPLLDSDGGWTFYDEGFGHYDPKLSAYHNKDENIDYGLLHEWGHSVLHLPDEYRLGFEEPNKFDILISSAIPEMWRKYSVASRRDNPGLMSPISDKFGEYAYRRILQRNKEGYMHDLPKIKLEETFYPSSVPNFLEFVFEGVESGDDFQVFQTRDLGVNGEGPEGVVMTPLFEGKLGDDRSFKVPGSEFSKGSFRLPGFGETDFIKVNDGRFAIVFSGKDLRQKKIRWLDLRDFHLACERGFRDQAKLSMKAAGHEDTPQAFDFKIDMEG